MISVGRSGHQHLLNPVDIGGFGSGWKIEEPHSGRTHSGRIHFVKNENVNGPGDWSTHRGYNPGIASVDWLTTFKLSRCIMEISRRGFLGCSTIAAGASVAGLAAEREVLAEEISLPQDSVILFQGDSITDAGRNRRAENRANDGGALGRGYPLFISGSLLSGQPERNLKCMNRGISGHKVPDLAKRWDKDTIELKPTILSILIGVNDIWHKLNGRYNGNVADYETGLKALLERTREKLPQTKIMICEPFVLRCGAVNDKWFPEFDERRAACRRVSDSLGCLWVPFQTMFDEAISDVVKPNYWAGDGVHPSVAGHALMAKTWLQTLNDAPA